MTFRKNRTVSSNLSVRAPCHKNTVNSTASISSWPACSYLARHDRTRPSRKHPLSKDYSPECVESEFCELRVETVWKSWRCPNRGLTRVRTGTFRHRTPTKLALGGLLEPLFRQYLYGVLRSSA